MATDRAAHFDKRIWRRPSDWLFAQAPRGQRGLSTVEYALLALGVMGIVGLVLLIFRGGVLEMLGQVSGRMTAAVT